MRLHTVPTARVRTPMADGFQRKRLHAALDGIETTRLGLVVAPAGSGKTTLLASWAQQFSGTVAWYRADAVDAVRAGLAQCLRAALHQATGPRVAVDELAAVGHELAVEDVVQLVEDFGGRVLLVVDDVHELAETPSLPDLERLLLVAPANLYIALGTRMMPALNLARLELPQPVMIVGDDLRFRSWEVEGLFRDFYAEPLRPDDAAALARRTDGWAAALQLFRLATMGRERDARSEAISSLTGRARYAQAYLSAQVLAGLPPRLREFVRRTCVFEQLTGARCDRLLEDHAGQRNLEELERRQALTTSEDDGTTFRYHEVFRRHLATALLEELGEAGTRVWFARAADILEDEGALIEALRARCRSADWSGVQRLLTEAGPRLVAAQSSEWAELLPPWLTQNDPWVALAEARHLLEDGQLEAADDAARRAEELFAGQQGRELCRSVIRAVATWRQGPHPVGRTWADVLRAAIQRAPLDQVRAASTLDPSYAELVTGLASMLGGDAQSGAVVLRRLAGGTDREPRLALIARLVLTGFGALLQSHEGAPAELERVCSDAERQGFTWAARVGRGALLAAEGTPGAVAAADELVEHCLKRGDPWAAALVRCAVVLGMLRRGDVDLPRLDGLVQHLRELDAGVLEAWARAARAQGVALTEHPDAEQEIRAAESFVRSAGVTGALAMVYAALADVRPGESAELRELARSTADAGGLRAAPWEWVRPRHKSAIAGDAASVEVRCFGGFRIRVGGIDWIADGVRPRARSLLRLMTLHADQPIHRERLADSLWPDMNTDAAMHNLQVTISALRKTLQQRRPEIQIKRDGDAYRLDLGTGGQSDVREFERQLARAAKAGAAGDDATAARAFARALEHYTGELLSEEGAEWVFEPRDRYRTLAAAAAASLAELELDRGDAAAAAVAAGRGVHIDRCHDGSWRALIRAHKLRGDLASAKQAQRGYRTMLDSLGVTDVA